MSYFRNLGESLEPKLAAERQRFADHLGPLKAWFAERGWTASEGRAPCDLILRRADAADLPEVSLNYSGRYDGKQELVVRLKLPLSWVKYREAAVHGVAAAAESGVVGTWHTHKETAFCVYATRRNTWIGDLTDRAEVEARLVEYAAATLPAIDAALAIARTPPPPPPPTATTEDGAASDGKRS